MGCQQSNHHLQVYPLGSGSRGNAFLFCAGNTKLLIDAGISGRAIRQRLDGVCEVDDIDAILISHEHTDHVQGLSTLGRHLPILCNYATAQSICSLYGKEEFDFQIFTNEEEFSLKECTIYPKSIMHDAVSPVSFRIQWENEVFGVVTDLGHAPDALVQVFRECTVIILEANHDVHLLKQASRPQKYKERVLGPSGHLSNEQCRELLLQLPKVHSVCFAHLSSECNTEDCVISAVSGAASGMNVYIAVQEAPFIRKVHQQEGAIPAFCSCPLYHSLDAEFH